MNFDRKFGNSDGKAAEEQKNFAELPRILDDEAEQGLEAASYQDNAGDQYPSGAFPALNIAYPQGESGAAAGRFAAGEKFSANYGGDAYNRQANPLDLPLPEPHYAEQEQFGGGSGHNMPRQNAAGGHMSAGERAAGAAYNAVWSEQAMADKRYTDAERGYQPDADNRRAPSAPASYSARARADNGAPDSAPLYANSPVHAPSGADDFAEQSFHSGLNGDSGVRPAQFDPSDYDYNYDAEAEAAAQFEAERQAEGAARYAARQTEGNAPYFDGEAQGGYDAGQSDFYRDGAPHSEQSYRQDYQPLSAAEGAYYAEEDYAAAEPPREFGQNQDLAQAGSYNPQGGVYQDEAYDDAAGNRQPASFAAQGGYERNYAAAEPLPHSAYDERGFAPQQAEEEALYPDDSPESDLPFAESYPQNAAPYPQDEDYAADFARLRADAGHIDEAASEFAPRQAGAPAQGRAGYAAAAAQAEPFFTEAEGNRAARPPARAAAMPADTGLAEADGYDDAFYDWAAPQAAAVPQAHRHMRQLPKKRRTVLYFIAFLVLLVFGGGAAYLKYGHSIFHLSNKGEPVLIHKAEGDYKIKPHNTEQNAAAAQEQSVTEGISGASAGESGQKTLIDKTETPMEMPKMEERLPFSTEQRHFDQSSVDSLVKTVAARSTPIHIVPSVTVDADRKITASSAKGEELLVPGADAAPPPPLGSAGGKTKTEGAAAMAEPPPIRAVRVPVPRAQKPAAPSAKIQAAAAGGGGFFMQISSQPSKEAAEQSLREAKKHLSAAIAGKMVIVPAAIPDKGTYYRVRIPAESREEAARLCEDYKQAGGHCFVAR